MCLICLHTNSQSRPRQQAFSASRRWVTSPSAQTMHSRALICLSGLLSFWRFKASDVIVWICDVWILFNTICAVTLIKLFQLSGPSDHNSKSLIHCTRVKEKKVWICFHWFYPLILAIELMYYFYICKTQRPLLFTQIQREEAGYLRVEGLHSAQNHENAKF